MRAALFLGGSIAMVLAAVPEAQAQYASCNTTADCPAPLVCGQGLCRRAGCYAVADCRSPLDQCIAGRCYDAWDQYWMGQTLIDVRLEEKSPTVGLLLGLLFPGLGNFYAADPLGLIPLLMYGGGFGLLMWGATSADTEPDDAVGVLAPVIAGSVLVLAGYVISPIWGYISVEDYNEELRASMLDARDPRPAMAGGGVRVGVAPGALVMRW